MDLIHVTMNSTNVLTIIIGFIVFFIGYLIKYQKMSEIISGLNPLKIKDKEGLGRWVGGNIILIGISGLFFGSVGLVVDLNYASLLIYVYLVCLFLITLRMSQGSKRYLY